MAIGIVVVIGLVLLYLWIDGSTPENPNNRD